MERRDRRHPVSHRDVGAPVAHDSRVRVKEVRGDWPQLGRRG
jgi:hypothetical protein